jgi:amino-acid N-acetyltransferase
VQRDEGNATIRPARADDLDPVLELLRSAELPGAGVAEHFTGFVVADDGSAIVGAAGVERYGEHALLRSVAVAPEWRGRGLGAQLVDRALELARQVAVKDVFLLTTTAEHYFPRHGFRVVGRDDVPAPVRASVEFRGACPASATVMLRELQST